MGNWYLLRSRPKEEVRAVLHLEEQGYEVYCPFVWVNKSKTLAVKQVYEPLFPGYMFINLDPESDNWTSVRSTRGIRDFVKFGLYIPVIKSEMISDIQAQTEAINSRGHGINELKPGDKVQIIEGSFSGLSAIYKKSSGKERTQVLIDIMGRMTEVWVNQSELTKIKA